MEKIVGQTLYNTNRDTRIVATGLCEIFITSAGMFYLYYNEGRITPLEDYETKDWVKNNFRSFSQPELERLKRFVHFNKEDE